MKKVFFVFATILLTSINSQAQDKWTSYTSELRKFAVATMGPVEEINKEDEDKTTYKINFANGSMNYLVSSVDHHSNLENKIEELLTVSINSFKEAINGTIEIEEDIYHNSVKGKYALMIFQEDTIKLEYYTYIKGNFQYQLVIYAEKDLYDQEEANFVKESFKVLE